MARARQASGDAAELLGRRAVLDHVALGHQGEDLARGQQAVGGEQLVVRAAAADPRALERRLAEPHAGASVEAAEHEDGGGLAGQDGADGLADHRARGGATWAVLAEVGQIADPETVGEVVATDVVHVAADDAVDVGGGEPRIGERRQ